MISLQNQRVGVFIDVQNMYYSAKALYSQKVDFGKILSLGVGDRTLIRAIAYVIRAEVDTEQQFFDALRDRGLELRIKDLQTFYGGNKKGDWDIGIAMDIMRMASKLDVVILVSGDGDFADLLKHVKSLGCYTEVLAFGPSSSTHIRAEADKFTDLSEHLGTVLIPDYRKSRGRKTPNRAPRKQAKDAKLKPAELPPSGSPTSPKKPVEKKTVDQVPALAPQKKPVRKPSSRRNGSPRSGGAGQLTVPSQKKAPARKPAAQKPTAKPAPKPAPKPKRTAKLASAPKRPRKRTTPAKKTT